METLITFKTAKLNYFLFKININRENCFAVLFFSYIFVKNLSVLILFAEFRWK